MLSLAPLPVIAAAAVIAAVAPLASPLLLAAPLALPTPVLVVAAGLLVAAATTVVVVPVVFDPAVVFGTSPVGPVLPVLVPAVPAEGGPLAFAGTPTGAFPLGLSFRLVVGLASVVFVGRGVGLLGRLPGRQHRLAEGQVVAGDLSRHLVEGSAEAHLRRKPVRRGIPVVDDGVELVRPQPGFADPPIDVRDDGLFGAELDEDPRPFDRREAVHDGPDALGHHGPVLLHRQGSVDELDLVRGRAGAAPGRQGVHDLERRKRALGARRWRRECRVCPSCAPSASSPARPPRRGARQPGRSGVRRPEGPYPENRLLIVINGMDRNFIDIDLQRFC